MKRLFVPRNALLLVATLGLLALAGCSDSGKDPIPPPPPGDAPDVERLVPARTVLGDTVIVQGARFGASQGSSAVLFTAVGGGSVEAEVVAGSWSDGSVRVRVPAQATAGPVVVRRDGSTGASAAFAVAPRLIGFQADLLPLFQRNGCSGCHGGNGGLSLASRESLLRGGVHGPAVLPRRSAESVLIRKLEPGPPFGSRMPQGGAPLDEAEILLIADWIDQGARPDEVPPPLPTPSIRELVPARTVAGDTVVVNGQDFGAESSGSRVWFTAAGGGTVGAEVVPGGWTDTSIRVLVPATAASGPVVVARDEVTSPGRAFELAPRVVSYANDLLPLLQNRGCLSCHGGTNNLFLSPHAALLRGDSDHGPAVRPRRSSESLLVRVLGDSEPFGIRRMPPGSPALTGEQVRLISDWIDQGARNN